MIRNFFLGPRRVRLPSIPYLGKDGIYIGAVVIVVVLIVLLAWMDHLDAGL